MPSLSRLLTSAVALATLSSCYFEGSIAYHPRVALPNVADRQGWSASANIGIYLDVMIPSRTIRGIGAGLAVFNGYGIKQFDGGKQAGGGIGGRGDVVLGPHWLSRHLDHSLVFNYHFLNDITPGVDGSAWFAGLGLDYRWKVQAWTGKMKNWLFRLNAGVERFSADDMSSTGIGARFMTVPAFVGRVPRDTSYSSSSSSGPSCSGGYYKTSTDSYGNNTSQWTCP